MVEGNENKMLVLMIEWNNRKKKEDLKIIASEAVDEFTEEISELIEGEEQAVVEVSG